MTTHNSPDEVRSLWQSQTVPPFQISPDELRLKMKRLNRKLLFRDSIVYVICAGETVWFTYWILATRIPVTLRVGFILIILAMGFLAGQIWLDQHSRKAHIWLDQHSRKAHRTTAAASGNTSSVDFFRVELERQRNFHRGIWFWSRLIALFPGLLVCGIWGMAATPKSPFGYGMTAATLILGALAIRLNQKKSVSYQHQINALDALKQVPE
jgi:hypothetical protein